MIESPIHITARDERSRSAHVVLRDVMSNALGDLLTHYGLHVDAIEAVSEPLELRGHQVAGIIGFAGIGFGGTVAVRAPSQLARACLPVDPTPGREAHALGDWIAELSNQLLGRTKNKLIRFGTAFQMTPPTFAAADDLLVVGHDRERTSWLRVTTSMGMLVVMLELHTAADFELLLDDDEHDAAHAEGELVLF